METKAPLLRVSLMLLALAHALLIPPPFKMSAQEGGGKTRDSQVDESFSIKMEDGKFVRLYDESYALVIGASNYQPGSGWTKLRGVEKDVEAVSVALERQGFKVTVVKDPSAALLEDSFKKFIAQSGRNVNNRLLFYFAGHGHTMKQSYGSDMGYIVPVDAPNPERDPGGFRAKAMDMEQIKVYARRIQAKHALFLFDSCFSGSLLFTPSRAGERNVIDYKTTQHVRQFITAGDANETVPDDSIFRRQFVQAIEGDADLNRDGYVTGTELGEFLQEKVIAYSEKPQHPQYGKIRVENLDRGDFVFVLPKAPQPPPPVAANNPAPAPSVLRVDPAAVELAFWNSIQNSADPEDFKEYEDKYPSGQFVNLARRRREALMKAAKPAPATPAGGNTNTTGRAASPKPGKVVRGSAGIELVYVPAGNFMMGSANNKYDDERPVHRVTISEGFYMGRYEVTQAQWQAVMGNNPSHFKGCDNCPVEQVSWNDAQEFINKLNAANDGFNYRLPTEAEWEYACRAGTTGDYAGDLDSMEWYGYEKAGKKTHPVGQKRANRFGLYDMQGNVHEWVQDYYHDSYTGAPSDGSAWSSGGDSNFRVVRGGAWNVVASLVRFAARDRYDPALSYGTSGFRVAAVARQ